MMKWKSEIEIMKEAYEKAYRAYHKAIREELKKNSKLALALKNLRMKQSEAAYKAHKAAFEKYKRYFNQKDS